MDYVRGCTIRKLEIKKQRSLARVCIKLPRFVNSIRFLSLLVYPVCVLSTMLHYLVSIIHRLYPRLVRFYIRVKKNYPRNVVYKLQIKNRYSH